MEACKTASTCTTEVAQGTHVFDIVSYSKHRGMGNDASSYVRSTTFTVGGHDWAIRLYPDGYHKQYKNYISVYLELMSPSTKVRASCDLRLVDQFTGISSSVHKTEPRVFNSSDNTRFAPAAPNFKRRSEVEDSAFLRDDRLTIECIVTVMKTPHVAETRSLPRIDVPPSDIAEHVGRLLEGKQAGFDVSFSVGGENFEAHRFVLAMRSPVFKAELYGSMMEATTTGQHIVIEDMQPAVFGALLHFIYTDSLPPKDLDNNTEMIRLLLVAADRYAMERLKLLCGSILCEGLNAGNVATTLALADQHSCDKLKGACFEFIETSVAMDAVVATQGFQDLMVTCPALVVEALEKRRKFRKA